MKKTISDGAVQETISGWTRHRPPWLLISHLEHQSFYNISEQKLYATGIPQLRGKCVLDSAYGWLILLDRMTDECHLWNPWATDIIELPKLECSDRFITCTLSKPPTDPDCHVLFNSVGGTRQAFCRIGNGDDKLIVVEHQSRNIFLEASVSFKGEVYGINTSPGGVTQLVTIHFNFAQETLELRPLMTEEGRVWELDDIGYCHHWVKVSNYYLVESLSGDEILLVERMSSDVFDQTTFKVFRVDSHLKEFVEIYNLGGQAIFFSSNGGGWCYSSKGIQPNCIYYTVDGSRNLYIYDLNDQSTSFVLPCPDEQSNMHWIPP